MTMDDLFGDLPAAKHSAPNNSNDAPSAAAPSAMTTAVSSLIAPATAVDDSNPKQPAQETTTASKSKSLVSSLGTAGTSMAFVPQALRKKKRPAPVPKEDAKRPRNDDQENVPTEENGGGSSSINVNHNNVPIDTVTIQPSTILHDTDTLEPEDVDEPITANNKDNDEPYLENEPHELRQLHEAAKLHPHPYNPHVPNDYLAYRQRKKTEAVRKEMEAAALAKMKQHEKLRRKVEEERKRLEESGDVDKLVETIVEQRRLQGGRGRGRGVSNLPAWMVNRDKP